MSAEALVCRRNLWDLYRGCQTTRDVPDFGTKLIILRESTNLGLPAVCEVAAIFKAVCEDAVEQSLGSLKWGLHEELRKEAEYFLKWISGC